VASKLKAKDASAVRKFTDIPNVGKCMSADFELLGLESPQALAAFEPLALYQAVCAARGARQDPCVLDTCMAAVAFMRGAQALPWWDYTAERKLLYKI
jgi:Pathogenicity locus